MGFSGEVTFFSITLVIIRIFNIIFLLPVPTACVDAPVSDGPFPSDPTLSGSSTYAILSYIIIMY